MSLPFWGNLEEYTYNNSFYRKVIYTSDYIQLVVMNINIGEEIGYEKHRADQYVKVEQGQGLAIINNKLYELYPGIAIIIPSMMYHNIINNGNENLKINVIYSPPKHPYDETQKYKQSD